MQGITGKEDKWSRRLPVYLVLDCSGSMSGEPVEAVQMALQTLVSDLLDDSQAIETIWLSVIIFNNKAEQIVPLTEIDSFQPPSLSAGGTTSLGEAINLLLKCLDNDTRASSENSKGDYEPLVFLMTDGMPTDNWENAAEKLKQRRLGNIIGCAAGPEAEEDILKRIANSVIRLQDVSPGTLGAFMTWVSASISMAFSSVQHQDMPAEISPLLNDDRIVIVP